MPKMDCKYALFFLFFSVFLMANINYLIHEKNNKNISLICCFYFQIIRFMIWIPVIKKLRVRYCFCFQFSAKDTLPKQLFLEHKRHHLYLSFIMGINGSFWHLWRKIASIYKPDISTLQFGRIKILWIKSTRLANGFAATHYSAHDSSGSLVKSTQYANQ